MNSLWTKICITKKVCQTTINLADPSMENPNQIQTQNHTHQHRENPATPPRKTSFDSTIQTLKN